MNLKDNSVLVTAGASGLGREIALEMARRGADVTVWDVNDDSLLSLDALAKENSLLLACRKVDLLEQESVENEFTYWDSKESSRRILVNNAGGSLNAPPHFLEETEDDWGRVINLNLLAMVRLTQLVIPSMIQRNYGRIVNLGSKAGRYGSLFASPSYVAVKGAIHALTLQLAQEFGPNGITCNAVCPGATMTDRVKHLLEQRQTPERRAEVLKTIPLRRHGEVMDIASAVCFLASPEAGFITGVLLDVNGGQGMST
jgi:NAD(P)-dependent dehydrogenase (short-subunit alcohol dehydrogenase family)